VKELLFYFKLSTRDVKVLPYNKLGSSWWLWYDNWIYNYLCNQCLSSLKLRVRTPLMAMSVWCNIMW